MIQKWGESMDTGKVMAAVEAAIKQGEKTLEALRAIQALVNEQPTEGQQAKFLVGWYAGVWQKQYRRPLVVNWPKDMAILKRLLKSGISVEECQRRMTAFLQDGSDPFYVRSSHSIAVFASAVNRFGSRGSSDDDSFLTPPVADCKHQPPCTSDQQHTSRRMNERRQ